MKKFLLLSCFLFFTMVAAYSQHYGSVTMFDWNRIVFNPAFSGTSGTTDISVLTRQQWAGFTDAPKTQYVSAHSYLKGEIGIGGVVYNNVAGPTRRTGLKGAFAKHISLDRDLHLSMGLSLDIYQNIYDGTKLETGIPGDPAIMDAPLEQQLAPDASFGVVLYNDDFFVGLSSTNLTESRYDFLSSGADFTNPVERAYYLSGTYVFYMNSELRYMPGVLVKKIIGLPWEIDLSNRFTYKYLVAGLSFRSSMELSALFGIRFAEFYEFAYAFDYSFNPLGDYSSGSHEILLRFRLPNYFRSNDRGRAGKISFPWS